MPVCGVRVKGPWHPGVRTRGRSADGRTPHNAAAVFLDASTPALGPQTHSKEVSAAQGNGVGNSPEPTRAEPEEEGKVHATA